MMDVEWYQKRGRKFLHSMAVSKYANYCYYKRLGRKQHNPNKIFIENGKEHGGRIVRHLAAALRR